MSDKPRVRVKAANSRQMRAQYLRPDRAGLLNMRRAVTREPHHDVIQAAERAAALALDFTRNSGWLAGAVDQIITDTIGEELKLNARPDLSRLGYTDAERAEWCRLVEAEWRRWAWSPAECDLAGKATLAEMLDGVIRHYLVHGEAFGALDYMTVRERRRYGIATGTKVSLLPPHRLPRVDRPFEGLYGSIVHDAAGRATRYLFRLLEDGIEREREFPARDVIHVMDRGENPGACRGVSVLAPILKVATQYDQLADATLAVALMQQAFAAVIKSPEASQDAFQALELLDGVPTPDGYASDEWQAMLGTVRADFVEVWSQRFEALREGSLTLNDPAKVAHLGPGESLEMVTPSAPQSNYVAFSQNLQREMARRLGVTFESFSADHRGATYSSTRMAVASVWPLVQRRRTRIAAPFCDRVYGAWLDEMIGTGRIPLRGGYEAFAANRDRVAYAEWQGPAKPSADDLKAAQASRTRLENGTSTLAAECAESGEDWEEVVAQQAREKELLEANGLPVPFGRRQGGGAGPNGNAADGDREPPREEAAANE